MSHNDKLAKFLKEVSNWTWEEFAKAEKDKSYTSNQAIVFALVRSCSMQSLSAIKIAINRLDGKLKTPVQIEMPKVFYLYPNATGSVQPSDALSVVEDELTKLHADAIVEGIPLAGEVIPTTTTTTTQREAKDLATMGFRETLSELADLPRELPEAIVALALQTEQWIRKQGEQPPEIPRVKSVVAANLLIMAQNRNIDALTEVFDQVDGKLTETIQILGEDIYITNYGLTAPDDAYLNEDGILQVEATVSQDIWASKLGNGER